MTVSGVSRNNRVVERHGESDRDVLKSLDFRTSGPENVMKDPITFKPSGGEMIFRLPNGFRVLRGRRPGRGSTLPRLTSSWTSSRPTRRSAMASVHPLPRSGIKEFVDTVRPAVEALPGIPGFDRRTVLDLYPPQEKLTR